MVNSKRGRMSSADREKIHAMAERGISAKDIAAEVERRIDVIEAVLGVKKSAGRGRKPKLTEPPRRSSAPVAPPATTAAKAVSSGNKSTLNHQLWVRPGFQIELTLPGDLSQAEAERLSVMVRNLPFSR